MKNMSWIDGQTWDLFEHSIKGKKVFLFGVGVEANIFFRRYADIVKLEGVIDNNLKKQGFTVGEFVAEAYERNGSDKLISNLSILEQYNFTQVVVLIASKRYYEQMIQQLETIGVSSYFVINLMERDVSSQVDASIIQREIFVQECCAKPIEKKKIFFQSFSNYADHGKYITEELIRQKSDWDIVWAVNDLTINVPKGVRLVYRGNWKKYIYEIETAKMWISDLSMPEYIVKREENIYIQTKHWASITLKKFYLDGDTFKAEPEKIALWKRESRIIDYIIVGSEFDRESCKRGFQFDKEFIMAGSPRSDGVFDAGKQRDKVFSHYEIRESKRMLLYAPTYRFDKIKGKSIHESREIDLEFEVVKDALEERFGGEWVIALRLHPSVAKAAKEMELPRFVFDASTYDDSEELIAAADIVISDYSSIMFEAAFVNKPVFLFAADVEEYIRNEYELLIDYRKLPFDIAESSEEIYSSIINFDGKLYEERLQTFFNTYGVHEDGHASERAARAIDELMRTGKISSAE